VLYYSIQQEGSLYPQPNSPINQRATDMSTYTTKSDLLEHHSAYSDVMTELLAHTADAALECDLLHSETAYKRELGDWSSNELFGQDMTDGELWADLVDHQAACEKELNDELQLQDELERLIEYTQ